MSLDSNDFPSSPISAGAAGRIASEALASDALDLEEALCLADGIGDRAVLEVLLQAAAESKCRGKGDVVTVSRNIFIPLTNLGRNRCGYCTFAELPGSEGAHN